MQKEKKTVKGDQIIIIIIIIIIIMYSLSRVKDL